MPNVSWFYRNLINTKRLAISVAIADKIHVTLYKDTGEEYLTVLDSCEYSFYDLLNGNGLQESLYITSSNTLSVPINGTKLRARECSSLLELIDVCTTTELVNFNSLGGDKIVVIANVPFVNVKEDITTTTEVDTNAIYSQVFGSSFVSNPSTEAGMSKRKILFNIAPNDSLSAIETQADLLTKLLFLLLSKLPEEERLIKTIFEDYDLFKQIVSDMSVLTVKSLEKCMDELSGKSKIRALQSVYYSLKG